MPQIVLRPIGAGDLAQWTRLNAATNWEAVLNPDGALVFTVLAGRRDLYRFEPLPADAATVNSVAVFSRCLGDGVGTMRSTVRASGLDATGSSFAPPPDNGEEFSHVFTVAPGGGPWSVALTNAVQAGPESVVPADPLDPLVLGQTWLFVDYETSPPLSEPAAPPTEIELPSSVAKVVPLPSDRDTVLTLPRDTVVELPESTPIDVILPSTRETVLDG